MEQNFEVVNQPEREMPPPVNPQCSWRKLRHCLKYFCACSCVSVHVIFSVNSAKRKKKSCEMLVGRFSLWLFEDNLILVLIDN